MNYSNQYLQKFQTTYTQKHGLINNHIKALTLDVSGNLWIGTKKGVSFFDGKCWINDDTITDISTIYSDKTGKIWANSKGQIFSYNGNMWEEINEIPELYKEIVSITEDAKGNIWIATEEQFGYLNDKVWRNFSIENALIRDISADNNEHIWVATNKGLYCFGIDGNIVDIFETEKDGLLSNDVRSVVVDSSGHLWIGTSAGINIFDGRTQPSSINVESQMGINAVKGWHSITGKNGLPYEDINIIAIGNQQILVGTKVGMALLQDGKWEYFASKRWLPDDRVTSIIIQNKNCIWVGTPAGLSKIEKRTYSLEQKAALFDKMIQKRHNRYGYVTISMLEKPGDLANSTQEASDNDGLWTALYIAAESFRYAVTGEDEAKELAQKSLLSLMRLEQITSIDGFPARAIVRKGEKVHKSHGEWHDTPDGQFEWKGDTSSDEVDGHLFAYSVYYDLVANEQEKKEIAEVVERIMTHIVDNDFLLIDVDGEHTRWGVWSPKFLNKTWIDQQGLNSLEILAHLKTAYHITGNVKFQEAYMYLIKEHHYALNIINQKIISPGEVNHSDDELAFISYYPLLKYENEPSLRTIYLLSLERSWQIERPEESPLWNFIYGALTNKYCDVENSKNTLEHIPIDLIHWTVKNSHRTDIEIDQEKSRSGQLQSVKILPYDERPIMKWNGNPYQLDGGRDGRREEDGTFFLLPYWMGRYYGFL